MIDNSQVKRREKPIVLGPVVGMALLPLLLVGGVLSIPYTAIAKRVRSRRERRFTNSRKANGRTIDWAQFRLEINNDHGTLLVERFSFKGPVRMWWTADNIYQVCPYPLVDWFTMTMEPSFDAVRDWCHERYTSNAGSALLVNGSEEQWRTIRGKGPFSFQDGIRYFEVPRHEDGMNCPNLSIALKIHP